MHPIDRLAILRRHAAQIRSQIADIRRQLIGGEISAHGDNVRAVMSQHIRLVQQPLAAILRSSTSIPADGTDKTDWYYQAPMTMEVAPDWDDLLKNAEDDH
jgi:hypothetical protein